MKLLARFKTGRLVIWQNLKKAKTTNYKAPVITTAAKNCSKITTIARPEIDISRNPLNIFSTILVL
jgi:flagellar assembly factor FliW